MNFNDSVILPANEWYVVVDPNTLSENIASILVVVGHWSLQNLLTKG